MHVEHSTPTEPLVTSSVEEQASAFFKMYMTNPDLMHFSLLADLKQADRDPRAIAYDFGVATETILKWKEQLLKFGVWEQDSSGALKKCKHIEDDQMDPQLAILKIMRSYSLLSAGGPCKYNFISVSSNRELAVEYGQKINELLKEFIAKSKDLKSPTSIYDLNFAIADIIESRKITQQGRGK